MDRSESRSNAAPLKRPRGLASSTVPDAVAPLGITVLPSNSTGSLTVAEKLSPVWLILEPTALSSRTVITVPAGSVTGFGASARAAGFPGAAVPGAAVPGAAVPPGAAVEGCEVVLSELEGCLEQPATSNTIAMGTAICFSMTGNSGRTRPL